MLWLLFFIGNFYFSPFTLQFVFFFFDSNARWILFSSDGLFLSVVRLALILFFDDVLCCVSFSILSASSNIYLSVCFLCVALLFNSVRILDYLLWYQPIGRILNAFTRSGYNIKCVKSVQWSATYSTWNLSIVLKYGSV